MTLAALARQAKWSTTGAGNENGNNFYLFFNLISEKNLNVSIRFKSPCTIHGIL